MREYTPGKWGFTPLLGGLKGSVFPRALVVAIPNAVIAYLLGIFHQPSEDTQELADNAFSIWAGFTSVLFFLLSFRSNVAYNRWWEGGTLLQQTRGEWFNAYSSLVAFTSPEENRQAEVEAYHHMLARLMSLLFCSALQQVSPHKNRTFEIINCEGIDPKSMEFLRGSTDRVEVILQWIQRSIILNMRSGVLPIAAPVMSRAFQEISRGIVNLQNARKIADFPFPYPTAQASIVMLLIHWAMCPILASMLLDAELAAMTCFVLIFFLWGLNFIALQLESPFGCEDNDLPMDQMQCDWNKSVATLIASRAHNPPVFHFDKEVHRRLECRTSDGEELKVPKHLCTILQGNQSSVRRMERMTTLTTKNTQGRALTVVRTFSGKFGGLMGFGMKEEKAEDCVSHQDSSATAGYSETDDTSPSRRVVQDGLLRNGISSEVMRQVEAAVEHTARHVDARPMPNKDEAPSPTVPSTLESALACVERVREQVSGGSRQAAAENPRGEAAGVEPQLEEVKGDSASAGRAADDVGVGCSSGSRSASAKLSSELKETKAQADSSQCEEPKRIKSSSSVTPSARSEGGGSIGERYRRGGGPPLYPALCEDSEEHEGGDGSGSSVTRPRAMAPSRMGSGIPGCSAACYTDCFGALPRKRALKEPRAVTCSTSDAARSSSAAAASDALPLPELENE